MTDYEAIREAIFRAIASLNLTMPEDEQIPLQDQTTLTHLDSLAVINLLVGVEEAVGEALGSPVLMTDERTLELLLSESDSPLQTVSRLVEYVSSLTSEARS